MKKPLRILHTLGTVGLAVMLGWFLLSAAGPGPVQAQSEPTPRPSPTSAAYIVVSPGEAVGRQSLGISVTGYSWPPGTSGIKIYWDLQDGAHQLGGPLSADASGQFYTSVQVPEAWTQPGGHTIIADDSHGWKATAGIVLLEPTPTPTYTPTNPPPPPPPPPPPTTVTPSPTFTSTPMPSATPPLAAITPIVTATPTPRPGSQPSYPAYPTLIPTHTPTSTPTATPTSTPVPMAMIASTATFTPAPIDTATSTPTSTPTPTDTPTAIPTSTPTATSTATPMSGSMNVVGAVPPSGPSAPLDVGAGVPQAGEGQQATFLTGFIVAILVVVLLVAFLTVILATVLFVWQNRRKQQLIH